MFHIQRVKCFFSFHKLVLVATDKSCKWMDNGKVTSVIHLSFYECSCCGKRRMGHISSKDKRHGFVPIAVERWMTAGYLDGDAQRIHRETGNVHHLRVVSIRE